MRARYSFVRSPPARDGVWKFLPCAWNPARFWCRKDTGGHVVTVAKNSACAHLQLKAMLVGVALALARWAGRVLHGPVVLTPGIV